MSKPQFIPFPKTPHLAGSSIVDDDETVDLTALTNVLQSSRRLRVLVQEKVRARSREDCQIMDGSNVSVHFEREWCPVVQKRSGLIEMGERRQYQVFREYIQANTEMFFDMLGTQYCLFGEWLWAQHSVVYNELPNFLIAFDIYDKDTKRFLNYDRVVDVVGGRVPLVPLILGITADEKQNIARLMADITTKLEQRSHFGSNAHEGLYVRFEDDKAVRFRAKIRRKTFTSGRSDFDSNVINNKLAATSK